jgi:hypothetical protein
MPVIVVGADTEPGRAVVDELRDPQREIRVFVSDADQAARYRDLGLKVALGDVSDESHVEAACEMCFTAVLIAEAAHDTRERSFADGPDEVMRGWARAAGNAGVTRVIWVIEAEHPATGSPEVATVDPARSDLAIRVAEIDDAQRIV